MILCSFSTGVCNDVQVRRQGVSSNHLETGDPLAGVE